MESLGHLVPRRLTRCDRPMTEEERERRCNQPLSLADKIIFGTSPTIGALSN